MRYQFPSRAAMFVTSTDLNVITLSRTRYEDVMTCFAHVQLQVTISESHVNLAAHMSTTAPSSIDTLQMRAPSSATTSIPSHAFDGHEGAL